MKYDFDKVIDRLSSNSAKWSLSKELTGLDDVLPLWVADMDFACAPEIVEALKERVAHPIYGYTASSDKYYSGLIEWMKKRHEWSGIQRDWIASPPASSLASTTLSRHIHIQVTRSFFNLPSITP